MRTYSGQRPGGTSGAYNRSLCRSTPVLSHYPGAGTARLTMCRTSGRPASVLRRPARAGRRAGLAAGAGCRIGPHHPIQAPIEAFGRVPVAAAGMEDRHSRAAGAAASCRKGSRCPRSGTGSGRAGQCACRGLVVDLSCTRRIPAPVTCLDYQAAKSACAAASEVPGRLAQIRREESGDVPSATSVLLADPSGAHL